ncbi:MAG: heme o synthase [Pirellulales bacterium]
MTRSSTATSRLSRVRTLPCDGSVAAREISPARRVRRMGGARDGTLAEPRSIPSYWRLVRPGLLVAVLLSMTVAALAGAEPPPWSGLAHALFGTALLIAGASAMNQLMERRGDATMQRTASRPLPSGRLSARHAAIFAALTSLAGVGYLAVLAPPAVTLLAAASWIIYVLLYTPLKRVSVWHTPVGAVSGAIPVLLGAATANGLFAPASLALAVIVFFWQFPHTAAIGWIYRHEYARGAVKVAAVVDPSGRLAGQMAVMGALGLLLASVLPAGFSLGGWPYLGVAVLLGLAHLTVAARFLAGPTDVNARALWRMSLVHLPALLAAQGWCLTA